MSDILICSFYTPGGYYEECAERFEENVRELGLSLHLEKLIIPEGKTWPEVCREKIPYLARVRAANRDKMLFWVDVDCHFKYFPDFIRNSSADIIGFQRGFGNPLAIGYASKTRFWEPCFLGFGVSDNAQRFLDSAIELERTTEINATDDYFFEEAWRREAANMTFQVVPAALSKPTSAKQFFVFGSSSNVQKFRGTVQQHTAPAGIATKTKPAAKVGHSPLPRQGNLMRKMARTYLPDFAIKAILRGRDQLYQAQAVAKSRQIGGNGKQELALRDFNILVKKSLAFDGGAETPELSRMADKVTEGQEAVQATLQWGRAFQAYRKGHGNAAPVDLIWWDTPAPGNFGDWLSPYVVSKAGKRPVRYVKSNAKPATPHLLGIGSIIKFSHDTSIVLGSGIADANTRLNPNADYVSVRGPHTAACVTRSGGKAPDAMGDPGILMSKLYTPSSREKTGSVALVRHIRHQPLDMKLPSFVEEHSIWGARPEALEGLIDTLATKDYVITSAMHCFIVCQSYGIPCALVTFEGLEDAVPGDGTKYKDYLGGVGLPERTPRVMPTDLRSLDLENWVSHDRVQQSQIDELYELAVKTIARV